MTAQIQAPEVYMLEKYSSLDYFVELRDQWEVLLRHVENCLESYMKNLPSQYRSQPLPEQPDIVWGHRVLPNFRDTMQALNEGVILISHHDYIGLHHAWGVRGDHKGQMDYSTSWMANEDERKYRKLLEEAVIYARNICITEGGDWNPLDLLNHYKISRDFSHPASLPAYRVDKNIFVVSGEKIKRTGIYMPNVRHSCAEFLSIRYDEAPLAKVYNGTRDIKDLTSGEKWDEELILEERRCTWYLVERIADSDNARSSNALLIEEAALSSTRRLASGEVCQEAGFYFTPARPESRRYFDKGDVMPTFDAAYGNTIWQWDSDQAS